MVGLSLDILNALINFILLDLCDQQVAASNYAEAGYTLLLHANLLDWSDTPIDPMGPFTRIEPAWERKVSILTGHKIYTMLHSILMLRFNRNDSI